MTATIRACPTPGHAHPVYIEPHYPGDDYRVTVWASWTDVEAGIPRSVTYHRTAGHALAMGEQADGPIVDVQHVTAAGIRPVRMTIR